MRTEQENEKLAELLFPDVAKTVEEVLKEYPKRNVGEGEMILRFAPSPTGYLHIGGVYMALICIWLARQSKGVSILRIEDTDKKREVVDGISVIVKGLDGFKLFFNEGPQVNGKIVGEYGSYIQSERLEIYKIFAKDMVARGKAYPCFVTSEQLDEIRKQQEESGVRTGYYGKWALWREATLEEVKSELGKGTSFVIRLLSTGNIENSFEIDDAIKGRVTLRENDMDTVLLKSDGFPTYHFAHPIDDSLMGITLVTRGDEWFASLPLHIELFKKLGFKQIPYSHFAPLMKLDNDGKSKRKLSKRKDPEADIQYYIERGYPNQAVLEYLLTLANSNFYDWKLQNPEKNDEEFKLNFEKFNKAGALFDIVKLGDICKEYFATLSAEEVYTEVLNWAEKYNQEIFKLLKGNREYCIKILNIEREGTKIRKDISKYEDVKNQLRIFFDDMFTTSGYEDIQNRVSKELQRSIVERYLEVYDWEDSSDVWFEKIKMVAEELGFCTDRKEYEANKEKYKGSVGDVAMVIRVSLTGKTQSPDLYQVIQVLGKEKVLQRLEEYLQKMV